MTLDDKPQRIRHKRHSPLARFRIARRIKGSLRQPPRYSEFESFRAGLSGALPEAGNAGILLAACDSYYYRHFAVTLIASIERQEQPQKLHLHLCAPTAETLQHVEKLARSLSAVELSWTVDDCNLARRLAHRTIYYAASRFLVAPLVMEATGLPLLCIDVDGIAIRPVWPAYEAEARDADLVLIRRPQEEKPTMKVLASAVGFNPTPGGLRFAAGLGRSLAAIMAIRPAYHVDQIAIHYLLGMPTGDTPLRIAEMPKALWDHDFDPASAIWTAKGWTRKESSAFLDAKRHVDAFLLETLGQAAP